MKLAKVRNGVIFSHFDGNESDIQYKTFEEDSVVPLPTWALEFRENNIKNGYSRTYLVWDYTRKIFTEFKPVPNYSVTMATTKYALRKVRNKILIATDYLTTVTDINLTAKQKADALEYRQKLRDLTTDEYLNNLNVVEQYFLANDNIKFVHEFFPECPEFIKNIVEPILSEEINFSQEELESLSI